MRSDKLWLCLGLIALAACGRTRSRSFVPSLEAVEPSVGLSSSATPVTIRGHFEPVVRHELTSGARVNDTFSATLSGVSLTDVRWVDSDTLTATVPAGLRQGKHALVVTSPLGDQARLEDAYFARDADPARLVAAFVDVPPQLADDQTGALTVVLTNTGKTAAVEVALEASASGALSVTTGLIPSSLEPGASATVQLGWSVTAQGAAAVLITASARDAASSDPLSASAQTALTVVAAPALSASFQGVPIFLNGGQTASGTLVVTNSGGAVVSQFVPVVTPSGGAGVTASFAPVDLPPGGSHSFAFGVQGAAVGPAILTATGSGQHALAGTNVQLAPSSVGLTVVDAAALSLSASAPPVVSAGQDFDVTATVSNSGMATAKAVSLAATAPNLTVLSVSTGGDLAGGQSLPFTVRVRALGAGTQSVSLTADATDENDNGARLANGSVTTLVQTPPQLSAALLIPSNLSIAAPFGVQMTVGNSGEAAAVAVAPSALLLLGDAGVTPLSGPAPSSARIDGGQSVVFTWSVRPESVGEVQFEGTASGTDENSATAVTSPVTQSNVGTVRELARLSSDIFGDTTRFAYVFKYAGKVFVGPRGNGAGAVRMNADGSGVETVSFSFRKDTVGNTHANNATATGPYPSIGFAGCVPGTLQCGPDNEDGRAVFATGTMYGVEWLLAGSARSGGAVEYAYMTNSTGTTLDFLFVDAKNAGLGGATKGTSAAAFFNDRIYLGLPDTGGSRPYGMVIRNAPVAPGLNALSPADVDNLDWTKLPAVGASATPQNSSGTVVIDSLIAFNGKLYVMNNGGCARSTVSAPGPAQADWTNCTPTAAAYSGRVSVTTTLTCDLQPADKAVPYLAVYRGRLYFGRNTVGGVPQLFACTPSQTGSTTDCDPGDWSLIAPGTAADNSNFSSASNTAITLLHATPNALFVGLNNAGGVQLYRTTALSPVSAADFTGQGGCAPTSAACAGFGGQGLGVGATRILDSTAASFGADEWLYLVAGTGTGPLSLFRMHE